MVNKKYNLEEVFTASEACERYNITMDQLKYRLKPSKAGEEQISKEVKKGIVRYSGSTWLISKDFMDYYFGK